VSLNVLVSPDGRVEKIEPDLGTTGEFALAAAACVANWTFQPATKNGEPVFGWIKWQLVFADDSGELQWDEASRELLAALRAGTFKSPSSRELDKPLTPRERIAPRVSSRLGTAMGGDVVIEAIVDRNGRVQFPRVVSAPTLELGYAAATAALRWRFEPPLKGGEPVGVRVKIPFKITAPEPAPEEGDGTPPNGARP
jgi:TonB family protein